MTKVLLDPIYTQDPSKCASTFKMKQVALYLLNSFPNTFIYWRIPEGLSEGEQDWLPKDDRIKYMPASYYVDRHKEYHYVREDWNKSFMFRGDNWDIDLVITNRVPLIPLMRLQMYRPNLPSFEWSRKIVAFEDMPVMSFKPTVAVPHADTQDRQTLMGYLSADATAICAYWEKAEILKIAKRFVSPAMVRVLNDTVFESSPITVDTTSLKSRDFVTNAEGRPFTIGFAGRMVRGHNFDSIFSVMRNHWIYRAGSDRKVECVLSTVSKGSGLVDVPDFVEVKRLGREDFWDLMKNKVDVGIFLSPEEDYSLSLIEPLILGTPYVVYKAQWSVASLGEDYPFFVSSEKEAYAVIRNFYDNYPREYAKFAKWSRNSFLPLLKKRNTITHEVVVGEVLKTHTDQLQAHYNKVKSKPPKDIVKLLLDYAESNGGRIHLQTALNHLEATGQVRHLAAKMRANEKASLSFSTDFNEFRLALQSFGYVDASCTAGDLRKE